MRSTIRTFTIFCSILFCNEANSAETISNVHLLAITSGHYGKSQGAGGTNLSGAHVSGRLVLNQLARRLNPVSVTLLRSSESQLISRDDVFSALSELHERVEKTSGPDFVVLYLMAHGYGEGIGWNQFLQPGDVGLAMLGEAVDIDQYDPAGLAKQLIYVAEIVDALKESGARYMVLVDACYEGSERAISSPVFSSAVEQNIRDILAIVKAFNQFREHDAVVFSAEPGTTVQTVAVPNATDFLKGQKIGPLARRLLIILEQTPDDGALSIEALVSSLRDGDVDASTSAAISYYIHEAPVTLKRPAKPSEEISVRYGSAALTDFRMAVFKPDEGEAKPEPALPSVVKGRFHLKGSPGEYLTDGRDWTYDHTSGSFSLETLERGRVTLTITSGDEDWSIDLAAPLGKRFEKAHYANAQHSWFREEQYPGIDISGQGRACNDNAGSFTVNEVSYANDRITSIDVSIVQNCKDENIPISAELKLEFTK